MNNYGLHIVTRGPERGDAQDIDIVAVHGLGASTRSAWSDRGIDWLESILPRSVPEARILRFDYDSDDQQLGLTEIAHVLLEELSSLLSPRRRPAPIIFLAHGFGGLVVESAVIQAYHSSSRRASHTGFISAFAGFIFLGTPHRGNAVGTQESIVLETARALRYANDHGRTSSRVERPPSVPNELLGEFISLVASIQLPIACFFETRRTDCGPVISRANRKIPSAPKIVVDEISACVDGYESYAMDTDHVNMVKFSSNEDPNFQILDAVLRRMAYRRLRKTERMAQRMLSLVSDGSQDEIKRTDSISDFLYDSTSNNPFSINEMVSAGSLAALPTFSVDELMATDRDYREWLEGPDSEVLCLSSSDARQRTSICQDSIHKIKMQIPSRSSRYKIVFAYHSVDAIPSPSRLETVFLQSFIYQLCRQDQRLARRASTWLYSIRLSTTEHTGIHREQLQALFRELVQSYDAENIFLVLDNAQNVRRAEQECLEDLVSFIERTRYDSDGTVIKLLVTSTSEGFKSIRLRSQVGLPKIVNLDHNLRARRMFARWRVEQVDSERGISSGSIEQVNSILEEADWNVSMTDLLCSELMMCSPREERHFFRKLKGRGASYLELNKIILDRIVDNRDDTEISEDDPDFPVTPILRALALAFRPLTFEEVEAATNAGDNLAYILKICRPLICIVNHEGTQVALPVDEMVRLFMMNKFLKNPPDTARQHSIIAGNLLHYVLQQLKNKQETSQRPVQVSTNQYALLCWPDHARYAEVGNLAMDLYNRFPLFFSRKSKDREQWQALYFTMSRPSWDKPRGFTYLHFAAFFGLTTLVKQIVQDATTTLENIMTKDSHGQTPNSYAFQHRFHDITALLENTSSSKTTKSTMVYRSSREKPLQLTRKSQTSSSSDEDLVRRTSSPEPVEIAKPHGLSDFIVQSTESQEAIVLTCRQIIQRGASVNARDAAGRGALFHASRLGYADVVRVLTESKADPDATDRFSNKPLHVAALYGHLPVVTLLVEEGADVTARNSAGQTALHYAASNSHFHVTKYLVEMGSDPLALDKFGEIALPWIAVAEIEGAVKMAESRYDKKALKSPSLLAELAARYYRRFAATLEMESLLHSIHIWKRVLVITDKRDAERLYYEHNLLAARYVRYQSMDHDDEPGSIQAILADIVSSDPYLKDGLSTESLRTSSTTVFPRHKFLRGLVLVEKSKGLGTMADLDLAIKIFAEGFDSLPEFVPERILFLEILGYSYELKGDLVSAALEKSLERYRAAYKEATLQCRETSYKAKRAASSIVRILKKMKREREAEETYNIAGLDTQDHRQFGEDPSKIWALRGFLDSPISQVIEAPSSDREVVSAEQQSSRSSRSRAFGSRQSEESRGRLVEHTRESSRTVLLEKVRSGLLFNTPVHLITGEIVHASQNSSTFLLSLQLNLKFSSVTNSEREFARRRDGPIITDFAPKTLTWSSSRNVPSLRISSAVGVAVEAADIRSSASVSSAESSVKEERRRRESQSRVSGIRVLDRRSETFDSLVYTLETEANPLTISESPTGFRFGIVLEAEAKHISVELVVQSCVRDSRARSLLRSARTRETLSRPMIKSIELEDVYEQLTNQEVNAFLQQFDEQDFDSFSERFRRGRFL